jgi:hypothetical protein
MALIRNFTRKDLDVHRVHDAVECQYTVVTMSGNKKILQINTLGSPTRKLTGKTSQTIQFDDVSARALRDIIEREFQPR